MTTPTDASITEQEVELMIMLLSTDDGDIAKSVDALLRRLWAALAASRAEVALLREVVAAADALRADHTSFAAIDVAEKAFDAARAALKEGKP